MKICVFGGTFDPLHLGHENLINILLKKFDKVIIMPSKQTPGKKKPISSEINRLMMLSLCNFSKNPNLIIDDYELKADKAPSFTIDSIKYIKNKFKGDEVYLAVGSDQFNNLSNWHDINDIIKLVKIVCFNRHGLLKNTLSINYEFIEDFSYNISSSEIKNFVKIDSSKIKNFVNKDVFNYIIKEKLYQ